MTFLHMHILSIESSGNIFSIVYWKDGNIVFEYQDEQAFSASKKLAPIIHDQFKKFEISTEQTDFALFNCGPGSFTGLRVTLSFLKGLFFDQPEKIIGIPSFEILRFYNREHRIPIFEAKRDEIYIEENSEIHHIKKTIVPTQYDKKSKFITYSKIQPVSIFEDYDIQFIPYHAKNLIDVFLFHHNSGKSFQNDTELIYVYD